MLLASYTDKGIKKKTNQDALYMLQAEYDDNEVVIAAVCDGMGGLEHGEYASRIMVDYLDMWIEKRLPALLDRNSPSDLFESEMNALAKLADAKISNDQDELCGTTFTCLLLYRGYYHIAHIGDTRVYAIGKGLHQLTEDQTFVQMEIKAGRMTKEEARTHPQRNMLIQCVGAGDEITPQYVHGAYKPECVFLLCSDGFRHKISDEELLGALRPSVMTDEATMEEALHNCTIVAEQRKEKDNITAIAIKTNGRKPENA